jgi:uncharacterized protein YjbJ (UPF0337 family)
MDTDRIVGAGKELGGKAQKAAGQFVGDDETAVRGVVNQATGAAQNAYGQAKDAVRSAVDAAPEFASRAGDVGQRYLRQGNEAVANRIGEQQIMALLVAGAVGYALGWLLHGRD